MKKKKILILLLIIIIIINIKKNITTSTLKKVMNDEYGYNLVLGNAYHKIKSINKIYNYIDLLYYQGVKGSVSIKISYFNNIKNHKNIYDLKKCVKYAAERNINIIISSLFKKDRESEILAYRLLKFAGYQNIVLTLATYHNDIDDVVDKLLNENFNIRLVKGWWNDGEIKNWDTVSNKYFLNSKKLIENGGNHILATHDFYLLEKLYNLYGNKMDNIELSFFHFNKNYVNDKIKHFKFAIVNKSFYINERGIYTNTIHTSFRSFKFILMSKIYGNKCIYIILILFFVSILIF